MLQRDLFETLNEANIFAGKPVAEIALRCYFKPGSSLVAFCSDVVLIMGFFLG